MLLCCYAATTPLLPYAFSLLSVRYAACRFAPLLMLRLFSLLMPILRAAVDDCRRYVIFAMSLMMLLPLLMPCCFRHYAAFSAISPSPPSSSPFS